MPLSGEKATLSWSGETGIGQAHSGGLSELAGTHMLVHITSFSVSVSCFLINPFSGAKNREAAHSLPHVIVPESSPLPPGTVISPSQDEK